MRITMEEIKKMSEPLKMGNFIKKEKPKKEIINKEIYVVDLENYNQQEKK